MGVGLPPLLERQSRELLVEKRRKDIGEEVVSKAASPADAADFYVEIFEKNLRNLRNPRGMKFNSATIVSNRLLRHLPPGKSKRAILQLFRRAAAKTLLSGQLNVASIQNLCFVSP